MGKQFGNCFWALNVRGLWVGDSWKQVADSGCGWHGQRSDICQVIEYYAQNLRFQAKIKADTGAACAVATRIT